MIVKKFHPSAIEQAKKYIDSDALLIIVMDKLARREPLSVIRMGDGEASIMRGSNRPFLKRKDWLTEYGLWGADLKRVAKELVLATEKADWYCPNISGLVWPKYEILSISAQREQYAIGLFAHAWLYMGRVEELMKFDGGIGLVCRNSKEVADRLFMKYGKVGLEVETCDYDSWLDFDKAIDAIGKMKAHLIFCSCGPSGKWMIVQAAKKHGKVVIDTGSSLIRHWSVSKTRNI